MGLVLLRSMAGQPTTGPGFTLGASAAAESLLGATQGREREISQRRAVGQRGRETERETEREREDIEKIEKDMLRDTERWTHLEKKTGLEKGKQRERKGQVEK